MINDYKQVRAFAPASCANIAVGFDILGFSIADLGDEVLLKLSDSPGLRLYLDNNKDPIPHDIRHNTAGIAVSAMLEDLNIQQGFDLYLRKNIPLSAGLGGSAASAVAAVVALNGFLQHPLSSSDLLSYALSGEEAASGARHGDNVVPCLYGGIQLVVSLEHCQLISLPAIPLYAALVRPEWLINTRDARESLPAYFSLRNVVKQSGNLAGFISALYEKDYQRLALCCQDILIEPYRSHLIPYFYEIKTVALQAGALACSISGSGPALFALAESEKKARTIGMAMRAAYDNRELDAELFVSSVGSKGAYIMERL